MDEFQYRAVENGVGDDLGSFGMSAQGARDMVNALHYAFASGRHQESETLTRRNGDQFPRNNFAEFFLNDPDNRELLPSMGVILDGLVGAMNDSIEQEIISPATEATSPLAAGEHAPIDGEPIQETRVPNTYGSPPDSEPMYGVVSLSSLVERLAELTGSQGSVQMDAAIELPFNSPPSEFGRPPLAATMSDLVRMNAIAEEYGSQGSVQSGEVTRDIIEQSGPPHRNQFTAHGYTEESILDQRNKPILFWNGPRHQQFHIVNGLSGRLCVVDDRTMSLRHEERTRGLSYYYILKAFRFEGVRFCMYVLDGTFADEAAIIDFFRRLDGILDTYEFIACSTSSRIERTVDIRSIDDISRSVREEVYQEVLARVRREFAERERRQPPAAPQPEPTVLPTIDTDQGRSIVL